MKRVTQNLIISLAVAAVLVIIALIGGALLGVLGSGLSDLGSEINTIFDDGEVDTVEGHGAIFEGALLFFGAAVGVVFLAMLVLVGGYAFVLIVFAVVARAVFAQQGGRLIAYRIFMGIEYVLQAGLVWLCVDIFLGGMGIVRIVALLFAGFVTAGIVYSGINTYSKRICG